MDKYDTSQLTEFPRFEPESSQSGVSTFFNKLWKFPIFSPSETVVNMQNKALTEEKQSTSQPEDQNKQEYDDIKPETGSYAVEFEGRSLPNVLKRISSLVALGSGGGTRYADTELARYWMPDDISRECYECAARFSTLRRRHHCRVCGQIFCSRCCSQRVPGQIFGCAGGLRVCNYCCNVVLSYLKENDMTGDISPDLRTLQENLQVKFPDNKSQQASNKGRDNFMFAREQEDRCELRSSPKEALQDVFRQLCFTLPTQQHRYRLVRYNGVWRGCDILQWIMDNTNNKTRAQASIVCQDLLSARYMECTTELPQFADYALYRPIVVPPRTAHEESPEECNRLVESVSSYCLDLNLDESSARLIKATKTETKSSPSSEEENPVLEQTEGYTESNDLCKAIEESGEDHLKLLFRQCLARESLSASWLEVLYPLCQQAAEIIMPDMFSNDIDVRNYVQVKKVPGGAARDSCVVHGVVMTKNVAHRGMPQQISNPTILLLDCSIAYQRVEGKLTSLEPVLMQEQEYLSRCAARIAALGARVVVVRGAAARAVQDALRARGVALAAGLRDRALRRLARCSRADLLTSVDARIGTPRLGTCNNFYVKNFSSKTLMVLEGCAEQHLGCCILLRGAPLQELVRVKKVVKFMLLACYNWKLEKALLGDIEAVLPEPGMTFIDDDNNDNDNIDGNDTVNNDKTDEAKCNENEENQPNNSGTAKETNADKVDSNDDTERNNESIDNGTAKSTEEAKKDTSDGDSSRDANNIKTAFNNESVDMEKPEEINEPTNVEANTVSDERNNGSTGNNDAKASNDQEIDDASQKTKPFVRKADSDKNLSCGVPIRDFSDPLRATLSVDDDVFLPKEEAKLKADNHSDRWSTDDVVLSISPNVVIPAPYLETEAGRRCPLRRYFPRPLLTVPTRPPHTPRTYHRRISRPQQSSLVLKEVHPFIKNPITSSAEDSALKASLAYYRATGCRLVNNNHTHNCPLYKPSVVKKIQKEPEVEASEKQSESNEPLDPLAPENHQRLSLLLYSYSNKSTNVPDFCVNPWIVTMEIYGRHDISLGGFLQKYCFNGDYKCPSNNCQVPMNQHIRRFVHGDVCITITCNTVGHSNVDKVKEEQCRQVTFWSRCESCGASGRARRVGARALGVSLAQYVRLRCGAARLLRRAGCRHPLHRHAHAFACSLTTACFRYTKVSTYDIQLPPEVISINYDTKQMRDALIVQLNELVLKGHETYSSLTDSEAEKDYHTFKQQMDQIHLALTSSSLQEQTTLAAVVRSLWSVSDRIISGEKMLRDAQEKWSSPPAKPTKPQPENTVEEKPEIEEAAGEGSNDSDPANKDTEKEHPGTEEDEEKGDKKTIKQILSQLLSNNQPSNQSGMIISSGLVPVVVMAGEIGSVIAATLASVTYQRTLRAQRHSTQSEQDDNDNTNTSGRDRSEPDKPKSAKSNDHIEVLLKDGLLCRVYYAPQFQRLRHALLAPLRRPPADRDRDRDRDHARCCCDDAREKNENKSLCEIEEGFIRSLAHCVPWAARGGKSGSTFCKTKDDRYVLKEMTKPEWQQFLEFAPHYFNYVTNCHQNKLPSLLARILGVYSVGGAGNGVLVMENVWYACAPERRFDLKGSSRHRLTPDTQPQAVLMDENLLNLRWETQLYVQSHTGTVIWSCVERDTEFLSANSVMDYSLLLGIDNQKLVLGVIDYIRTFTWDKKLEHLVKKNLGSGQPTVVSPEQYKRRFCTACHKYFLQCPTHWDHLYSTLLV